MVALNIIRYHITRSMYLTSRLLLGLTLLVALAVACTSSGGGQGTPSGGTPSGNTSGASPPALAPFATPRPFSPPLETAPEGPAVSGRVNYWEDPAWQLPKPGDLPEPPDTAEGAEYQPPAEPTCPEGWELHDRQTEQFKLCFPPDWQIDGHGYVSLANQDDRYYSVGFFDMLPNGLQRAHVSVYATVPFSQPSLIMQKCEQAYQVVLAGKAAALCPDFPGDVPEGRIIQYFIPLNYHFVFVTVVGYREYDEATSSFKDSVYEDALQTAIQIAQTIEFYDSPVTMGTPTFQTGIQ
jgi:hypothetical protein